MKILRQLLSEKLGRYLVGIFILLIIILTWISNRPEPKATRQISSSSDDVQILWTSKIYFWSHVTDWKSNMIYAADIKTGKLLAVNGLTGATIWKIPFEAEYLLIGDQAVFTVTSIDVNAYRASTGELLWSTQLGSGHVSIYVQEENSLLRIYYGNKIFEISQVSGEILSVQPKDDIVWIQNDVEIHCLLTPAQDGAVERCWVGLTGVDRVTGKVLWKNNKPVFSEDYQEHSVNNILFVEFPGGRKCALNPGTGEYDWCLPEGKISNIAIDHDGKIGYFIRQDFSLVKIDLLSGGILTETQFLPKMLPAGMKKDSYAYSVAVTKDIVIASFGDSDQTLGLKFSP